MRTSGILLPVFSLPDKYGIGTFSKEAMNFIDFLKESKQYFWQILPIGPTGFGDSPYQSYSTYAISPMLIDLEALIEEGTLTKKECECLEGMDEKYVDYDTITGIKLDLLKKSYERRSDHKALEEFAAKEAYWLDAYAIYMGIHDHFKRASFTEWEPEFKKPDWSVVDKFKEDYADEINFHRYLQYKAASQWKKIKDYANENDVKIIGDVPIYVSPDGADVWINRNLFLMDEDGKQEFIAGVPGDYYAPKGQLWGNPLHNWEYQKSTGYAWWVSRMKKALELYDVVRIDHFRGFADYFSIPAEDDDASRGEWNEGPRMNLFNTLKKEIPNLNVIAEDLGFLTDSVRDLLKETDFPGMKVIQFAYGGDASNEYLPHLHKKNSVVYSGTHDNQTLLAWLTSKDTDPKVVEHIIKYHGFDKDITMEELTDKMVAICFSSVADTCIIPIQDHLCLGDESRINVPSTVGGNNWKWRMPKSCLTKELSQKIRTLVELYGR